MVNCSMSGDPFKFKQKLEKQETRKKKPRKQRTKNKKHPVPRADINPGGLSNIRSIEQDIPIGVVEQM
jgi:hypothetical protein